MDRAALVTGGSSGIGLAIARMLRDEGYGLTLASRRPERVQAAAEELGAVAVAADVGSAEDCARLVAEHLERFGRLDVLVNSAGIGIGGTVEDFPAKHFDLQVGVNLRGLFLVTQAWSGIAGDEMVQPEDCAAIVRMVLRLSLHARVPQVVIERAGSKNGDVPLSGA